MNYLSPWWQCDLQFSKRVVFGFVLEDGDGVKKNATSESRRAERYERFTLFWPVPPCVVSGWKLLHATYAYVSLKQNHKQTRKETQSHP